MSQQSFSDLAYASKKKVTRREQFLSEMDQVVPWSAMLEVIRPHYPEGKTDRPPFPLEKMLRVYCLQQWFALSDPAMEEALYDSESMRRFAGFCLEEPIPDETTILNFRHLLEEHDLSEVIFHQVTKYLEEQGLIVRKGTIVDATIIYAPSSTKNAEGERDLEMSSTKKGNQWHFGMKAHVDSDTRHGLRSRLRAQGEHAFGLVKNTWKHRKVRYRGLFKNTCQLFTLFALANLNMARYLLKDAMGQPLLKPR